MEIEYRIDDGYVNPGPHTVEVSDEDLEACETEEEKAELVDQAVEEDFRQTAHPVYENPFRK